MWILDSSSGLKKLSPIQAAILLEFAKASPEPMHVTTIIAALKATFPEDSWIPKKGTIYPAVHNLGARGYLKLHPTIPTGYSITEKGIDAVNTMMNHLDKQMDLYMIYYTYIMQNYMELEPKKANKIKEYVIKALKEFIINYQQ